MSVEQVESVDAEQTTEVHSLEIVLRPLSPDEIQVARGRAGTYPIWGEEVEKRIDRAAASLVESSKLPALLRPGLDEAYARVVEMMREHDPEAMKARDAWRIWNTDFAFEITSAGLVSVKGWAPEEHADRKAIKAKLLSLKGAGAATFVTDCFKAIMEMTQADEGKEPAQPSPPTSPSSDSKEAGEAAAQTATTP